jgi:hypothetical protein
MAGVQGRRHRTGVANAERLLVRVDPAHAEKARTAATALGISVTAYVDALLGHEQLDEHGRPLWWKDPVPTDQKELPLSESA